MSATKKRQQEAWWLPALIVFILALIGIRYASSQGWWNRTFNSGGQPYQTINTGLSVQDPNLSEVSANAQNPLNPGTSSQIPTSTDSNQTSKDDQRGQRALW